MEDCRWNNPPVYVFRMPSSAIRRSHTFGLGLLALVACRLNAQAEPKTLPPVRPLAVNILAGQKIGLLPPATSRSVP